MTPSTFNTPLRYPFLTLSIPTLSTAPPTHQLTRTGGNMAKTITCVSTAMTHKRGTKAKVVNPDGETEEFGIHAGVLQVDTLAPFLFVVALDYALRNAITEQEQELGFLITPWRSTPNLAVALTDLDYAG